MSEPPDERHDPAVRTAELIASADLETARRAIAGVAVRTPVLACEELGEMTGTPVLIKAESLQRSGSFKLRGALAKAAALGERSAAGLVTASAGNHARAVALAAGGQGCGGGGGARGAAGGGRAGRAGGPGGGGGGVLGGGGGGVGRGFMYLA